MPRSLPAEPLNFDLLRIKRALSILGLHVEEASAETLVDLYERLHLEVEMHDERHRILADG